MTTLDPTGARANEPGLTPAALKAERKAKARADRQAFFAACGKTLKVIGAHLPKILFVAIGVAIVASATAFDVWMSARGWNDLLPGIGWFAHAGAVAAVGFWYFGVFKAREELKKGDKIEARIWMGVAAAAYLICVLGVGIATVTNTGEAKQAAVDSKRELAEITAKRDELKDKLDLYSVTYWEEAVRQDQRALKAQLNIAKGTYSMPDLDIDGACAGKLNFNQQRACAYANGGVDPHTGVQVLGIVSEIEQSENGLRQAQADEKTLSDLNTQISTFALKTGDATASALGEFLNGEEEGNRVLLIVFVVLSSLFLLCGGLFGDWLARLLLRRT